MTVVVLPSRRPPAKAPSTPDVVIRYGWRDKPYQSEGCGGCSLEMDGADHSPECDRCSSCKGMGCRKTTVTGKWLHRTCPQCSGTGHR